jgi:hypothetical protein
MKKFILVSAQGVSCQVEEEPTSGWAILTAADYLAIRSKNPKPLHIMGPMTPAERAKEQEAAAKFVAAFKSKKERAAAAEFVKKYRTVEIPDGSDEMAVMTWADIAEIREKHNTQCHFVAVYRISDRMGPQEEPLYARVSARDEAHAKMVTAHTIRESVAQLNGVSMDTIKLVRYWLAEEMPELLVAC